MLRPYHAADLVARHEVGADRGTDRHPTMANDLSGDKADASDVGVTIVFAEAEAFGQVGPHHITVEDRRLSSALEQEDHENFSRGRFARSAQACKPDADPL